MLFLPKIIHFSFLRSASMLPMWQRLTAGSYLILKPKLLILDEPVNGLDFQSTEYLYQQISSYRQYGTILFSSHILESICLTSDRVAVLEQGQIKRSFAGQEIKAEKIREVLSE